jgi:hypothetical protein
MKPADKIAAKNIDTSGKTHPTTTTGVATPKAIKEGKPKTTK